MVELAGIFFFGFLSDAFFGDPYYRYHPIRIIGQCITLSEKALRHLGLNGKAGGFLLVLTTQMSSLFCYLTASLFLHSLYRPLGTAFDLFICYSCLALKDLVVHIKPVIYALETGNLPEARKRIALVVGRSVQSLDDKGVSRAAVETLAENFVDGFLSPVFWYLLGGILACIFGLSPVITALSFMLAFKVGSTLDSMVGYKGPRFIDFGWASAKLDDVMNFVPARLSLIIFFFGAWFSGLHPLDGLRVALRDRLKHDSPNAAHAESFFAGSLGVRLCGPTMYPDGLKNKAWLGHGNSDPGPEDISKATLLVKRSAWFALLLSISALLFLE